MFFSIFARNLSRNEILVVGILAEKGAARRGIVLKTSKLVTWSGLPIRTVERVVARLGYLRIVTRRESDRNFEYRVSMAGARKLERPTFPDRLSLSAQFSFDGFGCIPRHVRIGEDELPSARPDFRVGPHTVARASSASGSISSSIDMAVFLLRLRAKSGRVCDHACHEFGSGTHGTRCSSPIRI